MSNKISRLMSNKNGIRGDLLIIKRPYHGDERWEYEKILDFSANLNPLGPPEDLSSYVMSGIETVKGYPSHNSANLKNKLSEKYQIDPDQIIIGAGSVDLIRTFCRVILTKLDSVIVLHPTFAEYSYSSELMQAKVNLIELNFTNDFKLNEKAILNKIDNTTKVVFICNPNNPTGIITSKKSIEKIVEQCSLKDILVFVDETLIDFIENSDEYSCVDLVNKFSNLFVIKSFTKTYAIPGIRLGYGFGYPVLIRVMEEIMSPWIVSSLAQHIGEELLKHHPKYGEQALNVILKGKKQIFTGLKHIYPELEISIPKSHFFFLPLREITNSAKELKNHMLKNGILIRDCSSFGMVNYVRFPVKLPMENDKLIENFANIAKLAVKK
ncbi:MAG: Histidinol-phosphate aminotransferase 2 [Candidatus Heimdallarchaeota archaeon LC_2]|nr:MAG: Histidinol-phosphate aminotransferase 2 [Candidatus Heimdallarchaeota archaeon LC_2]